MSKTRLFLHIGHPKTGTTSIQTFLLANRRTLRGMGILYPETGIHDSAHRRLSPAFHAAAGLENQAPLHMTRLLEEIAESGCHTVILSFEGFCGDNPACFIPLRDRFEVTVIDYVRRQDHIGESRYAQYIRGFLTQETRPAERTIRDKSFQTDYRRALRLFAGTFGANRLVVRVFEREALVKGDLIADFLHVTGIAPSPAFVPSTSSNASLKRPYLAFKRHCNLLPFLEAEQKRLNQNLNGLSSQDPAAPLGHLLSPADRRFLFESQAESNAEVAREFVGRADGVLFHEPPPDPADSWEPLRPLEPAAQQAVFDKLSPENRACIEFLHRPARLALPGDPILPELPEADPGALEQLIEKRNFKQFQRRLAVLEQLASRLRDAPGRP